MDVAAIILLFLAIVILFTVAKGSWPTLWTALTGQVITNPGTQVSGQQGTPGANAA